MQCNLRLVQVSLDWDRKGQFRLGQFRLGQFRLGQFRLGQTRSGKVRQGRLGQARLGQARLGQARLGQARLGQARLGQARLGQARLGQVRLGNVRSGQVGLGFHITCYKACCSVFLHRPQLSHHLPKFQLVQKLWQGEKLTSHNLILLIQGPLFQQSRYIQKWHSLQPP